MGFFIGVEIKVPHDLSPGRLVCYKARFWTPLNRRQSFGEEYIRFLKCNIRS